MKTKRFLVALLGGLLISTFAFAQSGAPSMEGKATQEMYYDEFVAAAPNAYPIDSKLMVENTVTGKKLEVTVIYNIIPSPSRILDLSYDAWEELGLDESITVRISPAVAASSASTPPPPSSPPQSSTGLSLLGGAPTLPAPEAVTEERQEDPWGEPEFEPEATLAYDDDDAEWIFEAPVEEAAYEPEPEVVAVEPPKPAPPPPPPPAPAPVTQPEPAPVAPPPPPVAPPPVQQVSQPGTSPLYHLLVLDRTKSHDNADIDEPDNVTVLFKFRHGKNGYIIVLYSSLTAGPILPSIPDKSRIVVNVSAASKATLREYVNSSAFKRLVIRPEVMTPLKKALEDTATPAYSGGKTVRIQVGAFSDARWAAEVVQRLRAAGFNTAEEPYGPLKRILAVDIPEADVNAAVQRLKAAGFKDVWIRK